jgi:hypothetical protein
MRSMLHLHNPMFAQCRYAAFAWLIVKKMSYFPKCSMKICAICEGLWLHAPLCFGAKRTTVAYNQ